MEADALAGQNVLYNCTRFETFGSEYRDRLFMFTFERDRRFNFQETYCLIWQTENEGEREHPLYRDKLVLGRF